MTLSRFSNTQRLRFGAACCLVLIAAATVCAGDVEVSRLQVTHRHGQTFATWKDVAEGEASAKYRYSLYCSEQPITAKNLAKAELCYRGVLYNSAKLYGSAFNMKDRLDSTKLYAIIEEGGNRCRLGADWRWSRSKSRARRITPLWPLTKI